MILRILSQEKKTFDSKKKLLIFCDAVKRNSKEKLYNIPAFSVFLGEGVTEFQNQVSSYLELQNKFHNLRDDYRSSLELLIDSVEDKLYALR